MFHSQIRLNASGATYSYQPHGSNGIRWVIASCPNGAMSV
ncbi:Unknown protein sequence [Pseudomonas syringae pv. syringae]|uniref:Uncharacterized protein n=1 Tax=Pseudomonas syringae pv. apii TaxID=81036 RepID=A0A3M5WY90_9PSED|nr:Unknown protein sequence [Pseudomonas syringae pv. aceris]KPB15659.1 Unknown protein sequence [Pseudomonas syringae pv. syringae]RMR46072.1 hypothetical protein ALP85_101263 [Pseudomonas syringae pv. syringae]RMU75088.1 hypothetical protein ALP23_101168 [Pseudomonas syringae pv. apii]